MRVWVDWDGYNAWYFAIHNILPAISERMVNQFLGEVVHPDYGKMAHIAQVFRESKIRECFIPYQFISLSRLDYFEEEYETLGDWLRENAI